MGYLSEFGNALRYGVKRIGANAGQAAKYLPGASSVGQIARHAQSGASRLGVNIRNGIGSLVEGVFGKPQQSIAQQQQSLIPNNPAPMDNLGSSGPIGGGGSSDVIGGGLAGMGSGSGAGSGVGSWLPDVWSPGGGGGLAGIPGYDPGYDDSGSEGDDDQYLVNPYEQQQGGMNLPQYGNAYNQNIGEWLGNQFFGGGPQNMVNDINSTVGDQLNRNANMQYMNDRGNAQYDIQRRLIDAFSGMMGGGGGRMNGFQDVNSPQFASLGGGGGNAQYGTNITAGPIGQQAVQSGLDLAQGAGAGANPAVPQSSFPINDAAGGEISQMMAGADATVGGQNANNLDRSMAQANAQLGLGSQTARAQQGLGLAGYLTGLNQDNSSYNQAIQRYMASLMGQLGQAA